MAPSSSDSDSSRLAVFVARLERDPRDGEALARVAAALEAEKLLAEAARSFAALASLAADEGNLALAVAAARRLSGLGEKKRAQAVLDGLVKTYAAGSPRIDARGKARPPAPPPRPATVPPAPGDRKSVLDRAGKAARAAASAAAKGTDRGGAKLAPVPLLSSLGVAPLARLLAAMTLRELAPGEAVIEEGAEAEGLFLLALGTLEARRDGHALGRLRNGSFFGEIALLSGTRRTATVVALEPSWVLEIPRAALEEAARAAPEMADTLARYARRRLLQNVFRTSEIFSRLSAEEREKLYARFEPQVFEEGTVILAEGEEGDRLHLVVSGAARADRGGEVLADLEPGDVFGEMSLIGRKPAVASVVATTQLVTLSLDRARFDDVAVAHPQLLAEVYKVLVERERDLERAPRDAGELVT